MRRTRRRISRRIAGGCALLAGVFLWMGTVTSVANAQQQSTTVQSQYEGFEPLATPEQRARFANSGSSGVILSTIEAEGELRWTKTPTQVTGSGDPYRFWKWPTEDALALLRGVTSEVPIMAAGGGAVLLIAARHDAEITEDLIALAHDPDELLVKVIEEIGNVRSVRPLAGVLFIGSLMTNNERFQDAAFTSLESIVLANLITSSLKTVFGRARPYQQIGAVEFKPFSGNTSFPSGHATTAFAFVTPWVLYYPNIAAPGLVALGAGTAFTRLLTDNHWFTDIVAGSAIGFATAYLLTRRHQQQEGRVQVVPTIGRHQMGLSLSVPVR